MAERDMREVVKRLHSENSEAVLELLEFDYTLSELLRNLEMLATVAQEVHSAVRHLDVSEQGGLERLSAAQDRACSMSASTTQLLGAFREMRHAVAGWNIADARRPSNKPSGGSNSSPARGG